MIRVEAIPLLLACFASMPAAITLRWISSSEEVGFPLHTRRKREFRVEFKMTSREGRLKALPSSPSTVTLLQQGEGRVRSLTNCANLRAECYLYSSLA